MLCSFGLLVCVAVQTGCNGVKPVKTAESDGSDSSDTSGNSEADSSNASSAQTPSVDESALNSEGQIVLGDPNAREAGNSVDEAINEKAGGASAKLLNPYLDADGNQVLGAGWEKPQAVLYVSGQQHGYIEPCGCTGLENQKGGLIRRDTVLNQLREKGWDVFPVDVGNQVRRIGRQAEIKFESTVEAFKTMDYTAATLGIDDLQQSGVEVIQVAGSDDLTSNCFILTNVVILDPSFFPKYKIVESGGRKIGITCAIGLEDTAELKNDDVEIADPVEALKPVVKELKEQGCDYLVLLAHASLEESTSIAQAVPEFNLVVTAGGLGEPTYKLEPIEGTETLMVQVGVKGQYGGIVGLFDDAEQPVRYQRIAITSQFKDSQRMLAQFASYQKRLERDGFDALGARPQAHPRGQEFVGSETCGECHTTAYEIWKDTPHFHATDSIVEPDNERGGIARHFDPECVSCHATGWNPQRFYPYVSGFKNPESTAALAGSGCENCHGPGKAHVDVEYGDVEVDEAEQTRLRKQMILSFERARDKCLECHDLDNSPDFKFDEYWEVVEHYGKD